MGVRLVNILSALLLIFLYSCSDEKISSGISSGDVVSARLSLLGTSAEETDAVENVSAYRFDDGILKEVFDTLEPGTDGIVSLKPSVMSGNVYFLVNAGEVLAGRGFETGVTSESDFQAMTAGADEMVSGGMFLSGMSTISRQTSSVAVAMKRSVARIDISSPINNLSVNSVKVKNVCPKGYVLDGGNGGEIPQPVDMVKDYADSPLTASAETLFYLPHQEGNNFEVEIMVTSSGSWHRLKTVLPDISRNKVYTLKVYADGEDFRVKVVEASWQEGDGTTSDGLRNAFVDVDNSVLSDGIRVNETRDSVFIPSWETNFSLAISGELGSTVNVDGLVKGVDVTVSRSGNLDNVCSLNVNSSNKMIGSVDGYMYVKVHNGDALRGRVVLVFLANPVKMQGQLSFDGNYVCDFGRYIDGELAVLNVPDDKVIRLEFDENSPEWMKLEETADGTYRILGGWRPNDADADGRTQEGRIVISDVSGMHNETYTVKRQNWGLPVVNINGTWWCKYNLRGNVKDFTDQILVSNDPARGGSIADYLAECTDDEYLNVLGDQYQAGNRDGLKLKNDGTGFLFDGYSTKTDNFGTLNPGYMAPDGYEIPDYNDYRFFTWGTDCNLGYFNPGAFNNGLGQRLNFSVVEREATFLGYDYGNVTFYDFEYGGEHLVLCGLGHQWSETGISKKMILFATYGNSGSTWLIEGYSKSDGRGNWFKFAASNAVKTRTIRCVKSPVEYIY